MAKGNPWRGATVEEKTVVLKETEKNTKVVPKEEPKKEETPSNTGNMEPTIEEQEIMKEEKVEQNEDVPQIEQFNEMGEDVSLLIEEENIQRESGENLLP